MIHTDCLAMMPIIKVVRHGTLSELTCEVKRDARFRIKNCDGVADTHDLHLVKNVCGMDFEAPDERRWFKFSSRAKVDIQLLPNGNQLLVIRAERKKAD